MTEDFNAKALEGGEGHPDSRGGRVLVTVIQERGSWRPPTTLPCGNTHNQARRVGVSPLPRFDFTLSAVEPRSKIMFLSTSCHSGAKQTTVTGGPKCAIICLKMFFLQNRH